MSNPDLPSEDRSRQSSSEIGGTLGVIALLSFVFGALAHPTSTSRFRILGCFLPFLRFEQDSRQFFRGCVAVVGSFHISTTNKGLILSPLLQTSIK